MTTTAAAPTEAHLRAMIADHERTIADLAAALPHDDPALAALITQLRAHWTRKEASTSGQPLADALLDMARWHEREAAARLAAARAALEPLAATPAQREVLEAELATFATRLRGLWTARLQARSRTASVMITGPANFPTRRNAKALAAERRRADELAAWEPRALAAIRAKLAAARTPDQAGDDAWATLRRTIDRALATVRAIDTERQPYDRAAFVTGIAGRLERLAANGEAALVGRALDHIASAQADWARPFMTPRHKAWGLRAVAAAATAAVAASAAAEDETLAAGDGYTIATNRAIDRLQIAFAGKPDAATRATLRAGGWRWSPREGAWQRQLTPNARHAALAFHAAREAAAPPHGGA